MRTTKSLYVGWVLLVTFLAEPVGGTSETNLEPSLRSFPWRDTSDSIRVTKALFDRIFIPSLTITNFDTAEVVLTPAFAGAFLLTSNEVARVTTALSDAFHQYRTVQRGHFEPMDGNNILETAQADQADPNGPFRFRLNPFAAEATAIRRILESAIAEILGPERTRFFWQTGMMIESEMPTNQTRFANSIYSFRLLTTDPGPLVDLQVSYPNGSHGRPYGPALDRYAPDELKPVLKRWREWVAQRPAGTFGWTAPQNEHSHIEMAFTDERRWDETTDYVDLPKSLIPLLRIPGLTYDEQLSPEATAVFGLTADNVKAVAQLYQEMNSRVEQLESANFMRPDPTKTSFVLRAFPKQMAALKNEWISGLQKILGPDCTQLLDQSIRTPMNIFALMRARAEHRHERAWREDGPRWFDRGEFEVRIQIKTAIGPKGVEIHELRYESDRPESGSRGGPRLTIPKRFRHLLTPEMLEAPKAL